MHVSLMFLVSIVLSLSCLLWESLTCALAQDPQLHFVFTSTDCIGDALDGRLSYCMSAGEHPAHCRFVDAQRLSDVHLCMSVNHVIVIRLVDTVCQPVLVCSCDWTSQRRIRKMKSSAIGTVKWFIEQGLTIQLSSPSGLHDIDLDEAIDAIEDCDDDDIRIEDDVIIFGMGDVCIKARN